MNFERNLQQNCFLQEQLTQSLFDHIPVGVGSKGVIPMNAKELEEALEMGMDWSLRQGYIWAEDKEHCEEYGRMLQADPNKVSSRAKKRGLPQLGTLGAGNHYAEIQVAEEIYDRHAAMKMGIEKEGQVRRCFFSVFCWVNELIASSYQVCVMIHCGSRGMGHQVATDALVAMEKAMKRDKIEVNDRQLACAHINSEEGQDYLKVRFCDLSQDSGLSQFLDPKYFMPSYKNKVATSYFLNLWSSKQKRQNINRECISRFKFFE